MKAVMISIQPEWCEKILNGEKTVEIRKTRPIFENSFKVYIYCTKSKKHFVHGGIVDSTDDLYRTPDGEIKYGYSGELMCCNEKYSQDNFLNGKVVAEFTCFHVFPALGKFNNEKWLNAYFGGCCMTLQQFNDYCNDRTTWGWYISNLKIYDHPKLINEFAAWRNGDPEMLKRPPQSWCYVLEKEETYE